ncbi:IclR family transcriptional regulator [Rhodobacteraceae bacterium CCMM004]|nr:IclR family transcriptional regulator [Rhodobacteraceae bacterium CCMM004]
MSQTKGDGTVGKALDVLDRVAAFGRPVRFSEVLDGAPYPKATLYRLIQILANQGMLSYDETAGTYALGIRLVRLAHAAWQTTSLAPVARPHIDRLAAEVGETVHLAQLDNAQVLYIDKVNPSEPLEMFSQAGKVGPAYCTGVGKAMLAHLPAAALDRALAQQSFHRFTGRTLGDAAALRCELRTVRARGYALDREEHEPGIHCIAAPILSRGGRVLGAVSVTSTTGRRALAEMEALAPHVTRVAAEIAADAQSWRFPDAAPKTLKQTG